MRDPQDVIRGIAEQTGWTAAQGLVPMVEPEVLMDGDHDIETCYEVTEVVLRSLFDALYNQNVMLEGTILKASMVVSGKDCAEQAGVEEVAESTLMCLKSAVPAILLRSDATTYATNVLSTYNVLEAATRVQEEA